MIQLIKYPHSIDIIEYDNIYIVRKGYDLKIMNSPDLLKMLIELERKGWVIGAFVMITWGII